jgi:hypothetical protein
LSMKPRLSFRPAIVRPSLADAAKPATSSP